MGSFDRLPPARVLAGAPSRFAETDGLRVHYKKVGETGPLVVLVHGWSCDGSFWRYQAEALKDGAQLLVVDLPGHGRSDRPEGVAYTHDLFVRALAAVLDDAEAPQAALVGHSAGGSVARHFARRHPQRLRALGLLDPTLTALFRDPAQLDELLAVLRGPESNRATLALIAPMVAVHTPMLAALEIRMRMLVTPPHVRVGFLEHMADPQLWTEDAIDRPVAALLSEAVPHPDVHEGVLRRIAPRLDLRRASVGHFAMLTQPDAVTTLVRDLAAAP